MYREPTIEAEQNAPESARAEACLIAIKNGDKSALEELYSIASAPVFAYAVSVLRNRHDSEDVLHDCFISIFNSAGGYVPRGKPFAWIITIAKNLCLMKLRERKRYTSSGAFEEDWDTAFAVDCAASAEDRMMIKECMTLLSETESKVVVLHAVAGFKHREIAEITDMPLMTVISHYRRAIAKLKKSLE
ncbi:MAG: RNA polymerase sigma factor [Clostridia bacterium]|nr:RNA polymerase sigma factor [Clostridia bacterium]